MPDVKGFTSAVFFWWTQFRRVVCAISGVSETAAAQCWHFFLTKKKPSHCYESSYMFKLLRFSKEHALKWMRQELKLQLPQDQKSCRIQCLLSSGWTGRSFLWSMKRSRMPCCLWVELPTPWSADVWKHLFRLSSFSRLLKIQLEAEKTGCRNPKTSLFWNNK